MHGRPTKLVYSFDPFGFWKIEFIPQEKDHGNNRLLDISVHWHCNSKKEQLMLIIVFGFCASSKNKYL